MVYHSAVGQRGAENDTPMTEDVLFRIYSMTKPIAAAALMQLYEQGKFKLDDPITKYIPEFENLTVYNPEGDPSPVENTPTFRH